MPRNVQSTKSVRRSMRNFGPGGNDMLLGICGGVKKGGLIPRATSSTAKSNADHNFVQKALVNTFKNCCELQEQNGQHGYPIWCPDCKPGPTCKNTKNKTKLYNSDNNIENTLFTSATPPPTAEVLADDNNEGLEVSDEATNKFYGGWSRYRFPSSPTESLADEYFIKNKNTNTVSLFEIFDIGTTAIKTIDLTKLPSHVTNIWVTLGGGKGKSGAVAGPGSPAKFIDFLDAQTKINGVMFDMEGWLTYDLAVEYVNIIKAWSEGNGRPITYVLVPGGGIVPPKPTDEIMNVFNYIAPMLYYGEDSYTSATAAWGFSSAFNNSYNCTTGPFFGWCPFPDGNGKCYIDKWLEGWVSLEASKVILTVQSVAATQCLTILDGIKKLLDDKGYAGVLLWPNADLGTQDDLDNLTHIINRAH